MSKDELLLTYEEAKLHPIGKKIKISEGFLTERLFTTRKAILFRVELSRGVIIPIGIHDCIKELGLYSGSVLETQTHTRLDKKKTLKIKSYKKHGFVAIEDSVFYAYLYKPRKQ